MDAKVYQEGKDVWHVNAFPTMRSLGDVLLRPDKTLRIEPDKGSDLEGVVPGPYRSIQDAMTAIGAHLGGRCISVRQRRF
jgi:hypothetical protein